MHGPALAIHPSNVIVSHKVQTLAEWHFLGQRDRNCPLPLLFNKSTICSYMRIGSTLTQKLPCGKLEKEGCPLYQNSDVKIIYESQCSVMNIIEAYSVPCGRV